jgi:hypothetical protein
MRNILYWRGSDQLVVTKPQVEKKRLALRSEREIFRPSDFGGLTSLNDLFHLGQKALSASCLRLPAHSKSEKLIWLMDTTARHGGEVVISVQAGCRVRA